jgi:hypothetical protein
VLQIAIQRLLCCVFRHFNRHPILLISWLLVIVSVTQMSTLSLSLLLDVF